MRERSVLWGTIAASGAFTMEVYATIGGIDYTAISAPQIESGLLVDKLSVGNCISSTLMFSVQTDDRIPTAAEVVIHARLLDVDGTPTEWLDFGTFYIDERKNNNGLVSLVCYDSMLKTRQMYVDPSLHDDRIGWPKTMQTCVNEIAQMIGVSVDERTEIHTGEAYQVDYPTNLTLKQVLSYIGAAHGGNWIITPDNKLHLVPLDYAYGYADTISVPVVLGKITTGEGITISSVIITKSEQLGYTAGDDTGAELKIDKNPYASQAVCDDVYNVLCGIEYKPYEITSACFDPCTELGDYIEVGDYITAPLYNAKMVFGKSFRANVSAPGSYEVGREYPYLTEIERLNTVSERVQKYVEATKIEIDAQILQTQEAIQLEVSERHDGIDALNSAISIMSGKIESKVSDAELQSAITQLSNSVNFRFDNLADPTRLSNAATTISADGVTVYNGKIAVYNNSGTRVFGTDSNGALSITGNFKTAAGADSVYAELTYGGLFFYKNGTLLAAYQMMHDSLDNVDRLHLYGGAVLPNGQCIKGLSTYGDAEILVQKSAADNLVIGNANQTKGTNIYSNASDPITFFLGSTTPKISIFQNKWDGSNVGATLKWGTHEWHTFIEGSDLKIMHNVDSGEQFTFCSNGTLLCDKNITAQNMVYSHDWVRADGKFRAFGDSSRYWDFFSDALYGDLIFRRSSESKNSVVFGNQGQVFAKGDIVADAQGAYISLTSLKSSLSSLEGRVAALEAK